ncbi:MAG TPA: multicopper oxidase domain-containing protein [Chryseolinea sp.]|nr:multicopper oxidase domain-containing protein [Chryseolinea sp.]
MKRRHFIKSTGLSTLTALMGSSFLLKSCHTEEDMIGEPNWIVEGGFDTPLPTLPYAVGNVELNAKSISGEMIDGKITSILSYRDGLLGPTIKTETGSNVNVRLDNALSEDTNIHWHGLVLPAHMEGHPKDVTASGNAFQYSLPITQRAGTYWYHPHAEGTTARQVFMGLAGMFIVTDAEETALQLPSGEMEIPLIIQDKRFDGPSLDYSPTEDEIMSGYLGETIVVNGAYSPLASIANTWYRLRLLNGSTARVYNLTLTNNIAFHIIGSDGGLLERPEHAMNILLGPGERADVLVDFSSLTTGTEVFLVSDKFSKYNEQGRQSFSILKFKVERSVTSNFTLPSMLSSISRLAEASAIRTRSFDISGGGERHGGIGGHTINHKSYSIARVDEKVQSGTTEIWEFDNSTGDEVHPMHIHGVQFQVLQRIGGRNELDVMEKGWKDTVLVMAGERVRIIMTFPEYRGLFVLHCHNLEHEDDGMMLNYEII